MAQLSRRGQMLQRVHSKLNTGAQEYEEDLDESTKSAHTHTLLEELIQLALIQLESTAGLH